MSSQPSDSAKPQLPLNLHSCIVCRQRKVKCDKQQRCSNCIKARVECVYAVSARPRRRMGNGKSPGEELLHRLRRYEALFRKHGLKLEDDDLESGNGKTSELGSLSIGMNAATDVDQVTGPLQGDNPERPSAVESNVWVNLNDEILESFFDGDFPCASDIKTLPFVFDSGSDKLADFHPSTVQIFRLWQTFVENVNPVAKIIHVPTVQRELLEASVNLQEVAKPFEALMFAIYASAITSLSNEECEKLTNISRQQLRKRYHIVAQQALTRAGVFGTLEIVVLQVALLLLVCHCVLYQISFRSEYGPGESWVRAGTLLRIGERIGLHRESYPTNISVLEAQIRRRLWWQIATLDARYAQQCGADALVNLKQWESPLPLNVNDCDLTSEMIVAPRNHLGFTEMIFCLMVYEIGMFLRRSGAMAPFGGSWQKLSSLPIPLSKKDKVIDELEEMLEWKYLRYLDPVIPLHILARSIVKIACGKMRLTTCHPRLFADRGSTMVKEEKDRLFDICLMMIEQDNFLHSMDCVKGFLWHLNLNFQVDALVCLLSELRYRDPGTPTDKAWSEISKTYTHHPNIVFDTKSPLSVAIGNLTLKSWEIRDQRLQTHHLNLQQSSRPSFISKLLEQRTINGTSSSTEPSSRAGEMGFDTASLSPHNPSSDAYGGLGPSLTPHTLTASMEPIDWDSWNELIHDEEEYDVDNFAPQTSDWTAY